MAGLYGLLILIAAVLFSARYTWWIPPKPWEKGWPRVLMYHQTCSSLLPGGMNTQPECFERQLNWLISKKAVFCTLSELADKMNRDEEGRFVALTFDDGFADNYEEAFPLVQKCGAKMTIFLAPENSAVRALSANQIQTMQQSGLVEFGAHTLSHKNLTALDDATAQHEIRASMDAVARLTDHACRCFAYPFGRFEEKHMQMVRESGMPYAVSTKKRIRPWSKIDPLAVPRISINGKMNRFQFYLAVSRGKYRV
jgi:peptidoglycan/xylan/chitin deacetylase (PgdA/CDA1 family)